MASRVNVKFVVILAVALAAVGGSAIFAYFSLVMKSGEDYEQLGDEAMAAGDPVEAATFYSKAVAHDQTNTEWLEKWIDAMGSWTPETRPRYIDEFNRNYVGAIRQLAQVQRTNIDAQDRYLSLIFERATLGGFSRGAVAGIERAVESATAPFEVDPGADPEWNRLRRYRGIAIARLGGSIGRLPAEESDLAEEDLRAVLRVDPADGESAVALCELLDQRRRLAERDRRSRDAEEITAQIEEIQAQTLEADPDDAWMLVRDLAYQIQRSLNDIRAASTGAGFSGELQRRLARDYGPALADVADTLGSLDPEQLPLRVLDTVRRLEQLLGVGSGANQPSHYVQLLRNRVDTVSEDTRARFALARAVGNEGDLEAAIEDLEEIENLPMLPLSLEGLIRLELQRFAPRWIADYRVRQFAALEDDNPDRAAEALAEAKAARDRYAALSNENDEQLILLDGLLASARGDAERALAFFSRYNDETPSADPRGLWLEARTAAQLERWGLTERRTRQLLELSPTNTQAVLLLASVEQNAGNLEDAMELLADALQANPDNEDVRRRLERLEILAGQRETGDPVTDAIIAARRASAGVEGTIANPEEAERILREALRQHDYDLRVAQELITHLINRDRFDDAREIVDEVRERNPENESIERVAALLDAGDAVEAGLRMIESSELDPGQKAKQRFQLLRRGGRAEEAREALQRARELLPEDPELLDAAFVLALQGGEMDRAEQLAETASDVNADRVGGLTYQARIASVNGNNDRAIELLEEAVAQDELQPSTHRLLGDRLLQAGRTADAVEAYRRSIDIQPDNPGAVTGLVRSLAIMGERGEALEEARRLRGYADSYASFLQLYLQLEAAEGGEEGQQIATEQRERLARLAPDDRANKRELIALYIQQDRFEDARSLIDRLREEADTLPIVTLEARYHAARGRVETQDGFADGLDLAARAFESFVQRRGPEEVGLRAYLTLAQFMARRGENDRALATIEKAAAFQSEQQREADRFRARLLASIGNHDQAAEIYRSVLEAGGSGVDEVRSRLVESLLRADEYEQARAVLADAGEAHRESLSYLLQSADIASALGEREEALTVANEAVSEHRQNPASWVKRAQILAAEEARLGDAIDDVSEALRLNPSDTSALRLRAALRYRRGQVDDAIADLREVVRLNPNNNDVLAGLIIELLAQDRDQEAQDVALDVVEQRAGEASFMLAVANVFSERERWGIASDILQRVWELRRSPEVGFALVDALVNAEPPRAGQAGEVLDGIAGQLESPDRNPTMLSARAVVAEARGLPNRAAGFLQEAFASANSPAAHLAWIRATPRVFGEDNVEQAAEFVANLAGRVSPGSESAEWLRFARGRILTTSDETSPQGESILRSLAESDAPAEIRRIAWQALGGSLYQREELEAAVEAWRRGVEDFPDNWQMRNNVAYTVGVQLDRPEEALPLAEAAARAAANRSEPLDTLAEIQIELGRYDEARSSLDRAERVAADTAARISILLNRIRIAVRTDACSRAKQLLSNVENELRTLPQVREQFAEEIAGLRQELDSAC